MQYAKAAAPASSPMAAAPASLQMAGAPAYRPGSTRFAASPTASAGIASFSPAYPPSFSPTASGYQAQQAGAASPAVIRPSQRPGAVQASPAPLATQQLAAPASAYPAPQTPGPAQVTGPGPEPTEVFPPYEPVDRTRLRALIISPGFGRKARPKQSQMVETSGYQLDWANVPDPETYPGWRPYINQVKSQILQFRPNILVAASKGGHYIAALWQEGFWRDSTLMINCHPSITSLPPEMSIVVTYGSNDQLYTRNPGDLLSMATSTGSPNRCFLYYCGNGGKLPNGQFIREGDFHDMNTLQQYDCLIRLMDAALTSNPEGHFLWSTQLRLSDARLSAEQILGYTPQDLWQYWRSTGQRSMDGSGICQVDPGSEEFALVSTIFLEEPRETPFFSGTAPFRPTILGIKRLEDKVQEDGSLEPFFESMARSLSAQGVNLAPGVHTRWAFHCTDPVQTGGDIYEGGAQTCKGLQTSWGPGYYFVRDAKAANDGNFCPVAPDGSKRMLLCLFMNGIPVMGDGIRGTPPFRMQPYRFDSWVDNLSNPELWGTINAQAGYPAYLISFAEGAGLSWGS